MNQFKSKLLKIANIITEEVPPMMRTSTFKIMLQTPIMVLLVEAKKAELWSWVTVRRGSATKSLGWKTARTPTETATGAPRCPSWPLAELGPRLPGVSAVLRETKHTWWIRGQLSFNRLRSISTCNRGSRIRWTCTRGCTERWRARIGELVDLMGAMGSSRNRVKRIRKYSIRRGLHKIWGNRRSHRGVIMAVEGHKGR